MASRYMNQRGEYGAEGAGSFQTLNDESLHHSHVIGRQTQLQCLPDEQLQLINSISACMSLLDLDDVGAFSFPTDSAG